MKEIEQCKKKVFLEEEDVDAIKEWLKEEDLNMTQLAEQLGITKSYLSRIMNFQRNVPEHVLEKLKEILSKNI